MTRREILVSLDDDLVSRIDAVAGPRERSAWIGAACERALADGDGGPQAGDAGDPLVWATACGAVLEAWRQECAACQERAQGEPVGAMVHDGGNGNGGGP